MGFLSGKSAGFYLPNGASTSFTIEAMTDVGDHLTYFIADGSKAYWDKTAVLTIENNDGGWHTVNPAEISYAGGYVTFTTSQGNASIRASGKCFPMATVGGCFEWSMTIEMDIKDCTTFGEDWERWTPVRGKFSGSAQRYWWNTFSQLTTAQGSNRDLTFAAMAYGPDGNAITIAYVNSGAGQTLNVSVVNKAISVRLATDGGGLPTSTASQIMDAVNANAQASSLVKAALANGSSGIGLVAVMAPTNLTGGTNTAYLDEVATEVLMVFYTDAGASKKRYEGVGVIRGIKPGANTSDIISNPIDFNGYGKPCYHEG